MSQENYICYAAGYSKENITLKDVETVLTDLVNMDDEHDAFWVSVIKEDENVLETHKDLEVTGIFENNHNMQWTKQFSNVDEVYKLYVLLLNEDFEELKRLLKV